MPSIAPSLLSCQKIHWLRSPVSPSVIACRWPPRAPAAMRIAVSASGALSPPTRWAPIAVWTCSLVAMFDLRRRVVRRRAPAPPTLPPPRRPGAAPPPRGRYRTRDGRRLAPREAGRAGWSLLVLEGGQHVELRGSAGRHDR